MTRLPLIGCALIAVAGCGSLGDPVLDAAEAESAAHRFYELIASYDFDALRAASSPDFEIVDGGVRMDINDFLSMLEGMQVRGRQLQFDASDFNTEVSGDVAYTTNRMLSAGGTAFLEAFVFRRTDTGWLVDRAFSTRATQVSR